MTSVFMFTWLVNGALASTALLACGAIALKVFKEPADRLRIIQWTFAGSLLVLMLVNVPLRSVVSLGTISHGETVSASSPPVEVAQFSSVPYPHNDRPADTIAQPSDDSAIDREVSAMPQAAPREVVLPEAAGHELASPPISIAFVAIRALCAVYFMGTMVFLVRWAQARLRLRQIVRNASPAPADVQAELTQISGVAPGRVLLLASCEVTSPIMWGALRPVIVLPNESLRNEDRSRLRYYLAHEWAHVLRGDYRKWQLATLLQFFLYYQPLFWWMRRQLATCMDQLADATASDVGPSAADYAALLVELARRQLALAPQMTLSINDKQSALRQRVMFLLSATAPPRATCRTTTNLVFAMTAILLGAMISTVRLEAKPSAEGAGEPPAVEQTPTMAGPASAGRNTAKSSDVNSEKAPAPTPAEKGESISYTGRVIDAASGKPIQGARVTVYRKLTRDPKTGGRSDLGQADYETDPDGKYTFVIPPEQVAESSLFLEVDAHHPNYAAMGKGGYAHSMIRKNLTMGEQPWFTELKMWPGEAVTGTVVSPEGKPLSDVEVSMYSAAKEATGLIRGSNDKTRTDANGRFRLVPATPGDGVFWILPAQYSPQAHRIGDRRGDWGVLKMEQGTTVTGRLLDAHGQPVADHQILLRRRVDGSKPEEVLQNNIVGSQIGREADSDTKGEFKFASLPDGEYAVAPQGVVEGEAGVIKHVFLGQNITISASAGAPPLEIRAVPHVVIRGTWLDGSGKPRAGFGSRVSGRLNGRNYSTATSIPGNDGIFEGKLPHGLQGAQLYITTNEHSSLRWQMSHDAPLHRNTRIDLGTIEDDISGLEVIRYTAPVLLIKPVDVEGQPVADCTPIIKYTRPDEGVEERTVYSTGSNVSGQHQRDNRWRSSQALPDEPMSVSVKKDGYTTTEQELMLKEGEERELVFVMKKTAPDDAKTGAEATTAANADSITYAGKVVNADTGEPISGAKVSVSRQLSRDPKTGATWREIEITEHESGPDGTYSFVIPPEQVAEQFLYLEVDAHHASFAAKGRSGYAHSMIRKNLTMGEPPFYSEIKLWPGEAITGTVVSPEGKPLPKVEILIYSSSPKATNRPSGSFDKTATDDEGKFRIVPATPGDGVLWITPEEYSPQAHRIANRRGDWGTLTMEKGKTVTGRILDAQGEPIPNVVIDARREGDGDKPDEYLRNNAVANHIGRNVTAGLAGEFKLQSLPDGEYELRFRGTGNGKERPAPLKHVLPRHMFSVANSATPQILEIRAVPHVLIKGTWVDSAGKPRTGSSMHLNGRLNGQFHFESGPSAGNDGRFEMIVPHGLERAELDLITNEHSSLRWRLSPDAPLRRGRRIQLGTVEDDVIGIQIVRYVAPILLVKPVDEQGQPVKEVTPIIKYTRPDEDGESRTNYTTGSNVSFEAQPDNRWRSSQALPDEPMSVTVKKDGYETTTEEVMLKEGEERELVFVMKKAPLKEGEAANADNGQINGTLQFQKK